MKYPLNILYLIFSILLSIFSSYKLEGKNEYSCYHFSEKDSLFPRVTDFEKLDIDFHDNKELQQQNLLNEIQNCLPSQSKKKFHLYYLLNEIYMRNENWEESSLLIKKITKTDILPPCIHSKHMIGYCSSIYRRKNQHLELINFLNSINQKKHNIFDEFINNELANTYYHIRKYSLAISHFQYIIDYGKIKQSRKASLYNNIALAYQNMNDTIRALKHFNKALNNWLKVKNDKHDPAYHSFFAVAIQNNIYKLLIDTKDSFTIDRYLNGLIKEYNLGKKYHLKVGIDILFSICEFSYFNNKPKIAEIHYQKLKQGVAVYKKNKNYALRFRKVSFLRDLYLVGNDMNLLSKYKILSTDNKMEFNLKLDLLTSTTNLDKEWGMNMLMQKEESLIKERQLKQRIKNTLFVLGFVSVVLFFSVIGLIRIRKKLKYQNIIIQEALENREMLLKEIYHRVKNNLQLVSSIAHVEFEKNNKQFNFESFENRIVSLSLIYKLLYTTNDLAVVNIDNYLKELISNLQNAYNNDFNFTLHIDTLKFPTEMTITIGLLINELITNTIKHCIPKTGLKKNLFVSLKQGVNEWELLYKDNGTVYSLTPNNNYGTSLIQMLIFRLGGESKIFFNDGYSVKILIKNVDLK